MEKSFYSLRIRAEEFNYEPISAILKVEPQSRSKGWVFEIANTENKYFDFINHFLNILEGNYDALFALGVKRSDITIWLIYAYHEQCNMEFAPSEMKRLSENDISLCISCYEVGH